MIRQWEITVRPPGASFRDDWTTFRFQAENKVLAHDHATTLRDDIDFRTHVGQPMVSDNIDERVRHIAVRFVGWIEEK